jgi:CBS domain-containing protein
MNIFHVCRKPAISVPPSASVKSALELMTKHKAGAVVVVENEEAVGIFTRRDAIERVVLKGTPLDVAVEAVMSAPVDVLSKDTDLTDALKVMAKRPYNHIPIVDAHQKVVGLATSKPVMKLVIERLSNELDSLEAFVNADGIGG